MDDKILLSNNKDDSMEIVNIPITYDDIEKVNSELNKTPIKGKDYIEVNQRIKAYRKLHPEALIKTEIIEFNMQYVMFKAEVYNNQNELIATGYAMEEKQSSFINKTSYVENCETSAIGRALGIAGYGIDTSIASAEEIKNAIANQVTTISLDEVKQLVFDKGKHKGKTWQQVLEEDKDYLNWMLNNTKNEQIRSNLTMILGKENLSEEDEDKKLILMNELNNLINENDKVDFDDVLTYYKVINPEIQSIRDMTLSQLQEAIDKLKK